MTIFSDSFKKVTEASYLTADKAWSYRAILRYFYIQHERMREFLFPEEVFAYLKEYRDFANYTEEQLQQDLDQLVKWNNLVARQEMSRAHTIEEFKKKRFRYQTTPYTVEFERMLIEMEKDGGGFGGSLEKKEFERLYQTLAKIEKLLEKEELPSSDECSQVWSDLFTYFRSITQNTSDYIAHLNSEEAEERMQTEAFLVFKDQFTTYLRDFIIGLQHTALTIQATLQNIKEEKLLLFIHQVILHQKQVPRFEDLGREDQELVRDQQEKWESLKTWFLGNEHRESELESLEIRTNEQIRRITRVVQRLGERSHSFRSRKKDYLYLAKWFDSFSSVQEAHQLSAVAFGVIHTRHIFSDQVPTDDIYTDIWEEIPVQHVTKPRIRNYREKTKAGAIVSNQKQKEEAREKYLKEKVAEHEALNKYMDGDKIELKNLPSIETHVRKMLLGWIGKAMAKKDRTFKTEHGRKVRVILSENERITLPADDGMIEMPAVMFQFLDEVNV
ncbi:TIGR02677 family protein [Oceanobacillus halophilus]|uniref:TIGR02677 family protein n=1 Tax=Oceanobacillus halophilus TaxID=930130 RepID=A0A495A7X7_9BACI|nr:TIGR02677 family protein [Oceanobacillus halophilus]RKQ35848.1 TIGR02677 family protein [Oceanobacillus halophilus]